MNCASVRACDPAAAVLLNIDVDSPQEVDRMVPIACEALARA